MSKLSRFANSQWRLATTPRSSPLTTPTRNLQTRVKPLLSPTSNEIEYEGMIDTTPQMVKASQPIPGSRAAPLDPNMSISVANMGYDKLRGTPFTPKASPASLDITPPRQGESSTYDFPSPTSHSSGAPTQYINSIPGSCTMSEIMECVVKIFVTSSSPNYLQPWQTKPLSDSSGSGFIVRGKRILTNAHVIADAVQVMVRRPGSPNKYVANVIAAGHECDLAVLEVEDEEFWEFQTENGYLDLEEGNDVVEQSKEKKYDYNKVMDIFNSSSSLADKPASEATPAPIDPDTPRIPWSSSIFAPDNHPLIGEDAATFNSDLPHTFTKDPGALYLSREVPLLQESVVVVGYPMGGDNLCITQGVVSRVEPVYYAHAGSYLLAIQIDAAINPGNSGGPALVNGRVVGVAFQNVMNASSVGYIIPCSVVLHFLKDVENGGYRVQDRNKNKNKNKNMKKKTVKPVATVSTDHPTFLPPPSLSTLPATAKLGFCGMGISCQDTFNPSLQRHVGMVSRRNRDKYDNEKMAFKRTLSPPRQSTAVKEPVTFLPDNTPAAYLHYSSIALTPEHTSSRPHWQSKALTLGQDHLSGVLLLKVSRVSPARGILKRGDILVAIDNIPVASDSTVNFRGNGQERLGFDYLFSLKHRGDTCKVTYLRRDPENNNEYSLNHADIPMRPLPSLVPPTGFDQAPQYLVYGGLVFVPLSLPYLQEFGKDWYSNAPRELVDLTQQQILFPTHQAIVMSQVLPDTVTVGYSMIDMVLRRVDGVMVKHLRHLHQIINRNVGKCGVKTELLNLVDEFGWELVDAAVVDVDGNNSNVEAAYAKLLANNNNDKQVVDAAVTLFARYMQLLSVLSSSAIKAPQVIDVHSADVSTLLSECSYEKLAYQYNVTLDATINAKKQFAELRGEAVDDMNAFASLLSSDNPVVDYVASHNVTPRPLEFVKGEDDLLLSVHSEYLNQSAATSNSNPTTTTPTAPVISRVCGDDNAYNLANAAFARPSSHVPSLEANIDVCKSVWEYVFGAVKTTDVTTGKQSSYIDHARIHLNDTMVFDLGDARSIILDVVDMTAAHDDILEKHNIPKDQHIEH